MGAYAILRPLSLMPVYMEFFYKNLQSPKKMQLKIDFYFFFIILRQQFLKHNLLRYDKSVDLPLPFLFFKRGPVTIGLIAIALILSFN